ncbi:MAG: class I SAM-dependent RNA methyltransferase, partial [Acholeplasmataceae bacterium]
MKITCLKLVRLTQSHCTNGIITKYMLPGEEAIIDAVSKQGVSASQIMNPSPHRVSVPCPIFYDCGGCDFLHIDVQEQCRMKHEFVVNRVNSLSSKPQVLPMIESVEPFHYRHKMVASATNRKQQCRLGLYREHTKTIIPFTRCFIQDQEGNAILNTIEMLLNQYKIKAHDDCTHQGIIKHILLRKSYAANDFLVVFVTQGDLFPNAKKIGQALIKKHPNVKTILQNIHHKKTSFVLLDQEKILYGKGYIEDVIEDIR